MRRHRPLPAKIRQLAKVLKETFAAEVDVERVPGEDPFPETFRFALVSPRFKRIPHLKRQDLVWDVVDQELDRAEALAVSMILAYSPDELDLRPPRRVRAKTKARTSAAR